MRGVCDMSRINIINLSQDGIGGWMNFLCIQCGDSFYFSLYFDFDMEKIHLCTVSSLLSFPLTQPTYLPASLSLSFPFPLLNHNYTPLTLISSLLHFLGQPLDLFLPFPLLIPAFPFFLPSIPFHFQITQVPSPHSDLVPSFCFNQDYLVPFPSLTDREREMPWWCAWKEGVGEVCVGVYGGGGGWGGAS